MGGRKNKGSSPPAAATIASKEKESPLYRVTDNAAAFKNQACTLSPPEVPYTRSNTEVVLSEILAEELFTFSVLRNSPTLCTAFDAASVSFASDGDPLLFRSFFTVVKADCAVDRLPELSALPSAVRSLEI